MPAATAQKCRRGRDGESVVGQRHPFLTSVELEGHSQTPSYRRNRLGGSVVIKAIDSQCLLGRVAEWQTRWLQVPVSVRTWGLKSPLAHQLLVEKGRWRAAFSPVVMSNPMP